MQGSQQNVTMRGLTPWMTPWMDVQNMKRLIPTVIAAVLTLGSSIGCKPSSVPAKSKGHSLGSAANEVNTEALIHFFEQNGFEMIDGKTVDQILPADISSEAYVGMVALRDTTVKPPNEFVVGVGSDTVLWFESHDVSGDALADWKAHLAKQTDLVKKLAASKQNLRNREAEQAAPSKR